MIYNIAANYHFFNNLTEFISQEIIKGDLEKLKYVKILLPNRRSCREFTKTLNSRYPNIILPKIKAISDISYDDFSDISYVKDILKFQNYSKLNYLFFLTKEISHLELFGTKKNFLESFKIANNLAQLFEDIELQGVDFGSLNEIDDSNLPENKKITLETLKILHLKLKKSLLDNDIYYGATKQNIIIDLYINFLKENPSKNPIIIAGSTGSVLSGKKLIKELSKDHYVILHGLNRSDSKKENHPQYFLNNLLDFIGIQKEDVKDIALVEQLSPDNRQNLLKNLISGKQSNIDEDISKNFSIIEAEDPTKEAKIISQICKTDKKTAIITNNNQLVKYIRFELIKKNIEFNDTTNKSILDSKFIEFVQLILLNSENGCASHSLLALLKHKYFNKESYGDIIFDLETKILRQIKKENLIEASTEFPEITIFLQEIISVIGQISNYSTISKITSCIIEICEKFSNNTLTKILSLENAGEEIYQLLTQLESQELHVDSKNIKNIFDMLFSQTNYFLKSNPDAKIQILSTIEARLLNFDQVIIASLNENDFPQIESAGWLGKKIKKDLGIDRHLKKIGQSAYDFCNYLSNETIFLTRHKQQGTLEVLESPFLLKFKNLITPHNIDIDQSDYYHHQIQDNIEQIKISKPKILPSQDNLFDTISITDITKLISNPYQIYIKKILKLKALKKIDYVSSYPEFGSFIHEVLEKYIKNNKQENHKEIEEIFEKFFKKPDEKLVWWPKFENIFKNFKKMEKEFNNSSSLVEKNVSFVIKNTQIIGKIDRIIEKEGEIEILDYKTGQIPAKKDIISGLQSQLTIAALIICKEIAKPITALTYFKLSSFSDAEIKRIFKKEEEISNLIIAAQDGLNKIIEHFIENNQPFVATKNEDIIEYKSLIRADEWE
ncbi:MAG: PD-(D/E)XK nuclease family protein [Rickettsiales bacterium]|nr:PD-(D/E)XK nuclease family protein [Rickettsiales bacterium]